MRLGAGGVGLGVLSPDLGVITMGEVGAQISGFSRRKMMSGGRLENGGRE